MKKNGFTLVELVITIALIGIIASISFVSINGMINEDKTNKCNGLIKSIKSAAREYVSDNRYDKTFANNAVNSNYIITIETDDLVSGNYLDSGINLYKNNTQYNNLEVTITLDKNLKYQDSFVKTESDVLIECDNGWEIK